jgi:hypothetical protein
MVAATMLCIVADSCAGAAPPVLGESHGCATVIHGVAGMVRPEISSLSCAAIRQLIYALPSEPQRFLLEGESPSLLWKCRLYSAKRHALLLGCEHHRKHFSVVKAAN